MCVTIRLVYDAILTLLGPSGFLFCYVDDVYMGVLIPVACALSETLGFYAMVSLQLRWSPKKEEVVLH
jgi:hypothetical protein